MQFIDLKRQYDFYRSEIDARKNAVMDHGRLTMGPEVTELEDALAEFVGVRHCIAVSSGITGLEIAFRALGVGPGDEVITVPFSPISSAEAIRFVGAKPVFVDIEATSFNMNVDQLELAITNRTRAILPVCLFGQMPDFERINSIAERHGIAVVEDAAQSFGATQSGLRSCGVASVAVTSFFPTKPLGCFGDAGALFTSDSTLASRMADIRKRRGSLLSHTSLGGSDAHMATLEAAVLLARLPHFSAELERRQRLGSAYSDLLEAACAVPEVMAGNTHVYGQYTIRVPDRDALSRHLRSHGIPCAVYFPKCLHEQPVFADLGYSLDDFPESVRASREVLSLPMHSWLTEREQSQVVEAVLCGPRNTIRLNAA